MRLVARARAAGHPALGHSRAVVGESFSEIFFGNSVALGMPCLTVSAHDAEALLSAVEANPQAEVALSVAGQSSR
jgi:3-isopropylmalate/(R)-2-methylmalate dehydratase small subunit